MSAWADYHERLLHLHVQAGRPSSRTVARHSGTNISHTSVIKILQGQRLPSWELLRAVLRGLSADETTEDAFSELWVAAYRELNPVKAGDAPTSMPPIRPGDAAMILTELQEIRRLLEELVMLQKGAM